MADQDLQLMERPYALVMTAGTWKPLVKGWDFDTHLLLHGFMCNLLILPFWHFLDLSSYSISRHEPSCLLLGFCSSSLVCVSASTLTPLAPDLVLKLTSAQQPEWPWPLRPNPFRAAPCHVLPPPRQRRAGFFAQLVRPSVSCTLLRPPLPPFPRTFDILVTLYCWMLLCTHPNMSCFSSSSSFCLQWLPLHLSSHR